MHGSQRWTIYTLLRHSSHCLTTANCHNQCSHALTLKGIRHFHHAANTLQDSFVSGYLYISFGAQSFVHSSAQTQLCSKKLFMWFQWFIGSKLWPNNTVNTKFCVKIFWGAHKSQPPRKCTVSHCANGPGWPLWQVNFSLLIAQLWPIMTQED